MDGGELAARVSAVRPLSEFAASRIMRQVLSALAHLHARRICHTDIKPENILFTSRSGGKKHNVPHLLPTCCAAWTALCCMPMNMAHELQSASSPPCSSCTMLHASVQGTRCADQADRLQLGGLFPAAGGALWHA